MRKTLLFLVIFFVPLGLICVENLKELEMRFEQDMAWTGFPEEWIKPHDDVIDVVIIGAGMAGTSAAFGLKRLGIHNIAIFDESCEGREGPWTTYGHMKILRSDKSSLGPSLGVPSLTFQAWYESSYGEDAWNQLSKATPEEWMNYLNWFRKTLNLPIKNQTKIETIEPLSNGFLELHFKENHKQKSVIARKVILATGRTGLGGPEIPSFVKNISKKFYAHSIELESSDFLKMKDQTIAIIGCGASAFDVAAMALEAEAKTVHLYFRRSSIPTENILAKLAHIGVEVGFYDLQDAQKNALISIATEAGMPPPKEAIDRVKNYPNLYLHPSSILKHFAETKDSIKITTAQQSLDANFIILATGFHIGISRVTELQKIASYISLWSDHLHVENKLGAFPYLGNSFQFLPKNLEQAPYLKNIYCFNYGALMSHGLTSSSIDSLNAGTERLIKGIAADFFVEEYPNFLENLLKKND